MFRCKSVISWSLITALLKCRISFWVFGFHFFEMISKFFPLLVSGGGNRFQYSAEMIIANSVKALSKRHQSFDFISSHSLGRHSWNVHMRIVFFGQFHFYTPIIDKCIYIMISRFYKAGLLIEPLYGCVAITLDI